MTRAALPLLALLLAGCLGAPSSLPTMRPSGIAPFVPPVFAEAVLDTAGSGGEPSIIAAPDGTLYVAAPYVHGAQIPASFVGGPADAVPREPITDAVWRSDDGGAAWARVGTGAQHATAGVDNAADADIAVDADGVVYLAGLGPGGHGIPVSASADRGATWKDRAPPATGNMDRPWLLAWGHGELALAWSDLDEDAKLVARSHDGARTWDARVIAHGGNAIGPLARDAATGTFLLPHRIQPTVVAYMWEDGGAVRNATFPTLDPGDRYLYPAAAIDRGGGMYVAWSIAPMETPETPVSTEASVWLVGSTDHGATWTQPQRISAPGHNGIFPWLVAGDPGRVALAYLWSEGSGHPNRATSAWWPVAAITLNGTRGPFAESRLSLQPIHVGGICGYSGEGCYGVYDILAGNVDGTTADHLGDRGLLDFFEMGLGAHGELLASFATDAATPAGPAGDTLTDIHAVRQTGGTLLAQETGTSPP